MILFFPKDFRPSLLAKETNFRNCCLFVGDIVIALDFLRWIILTTTLAVKRDINVGNYMQYSFQEWYQCWQLLTIQFSQLQEYINVDNYLRYSFHNFKNDINVDNYLRYSFHNFRMISMLTVTYDTVFTTSRMMSMLAITYNTIFTMFSCIPWITRTFSVLTIALSFVTAYNLLNTRKYSICT